MFLRRNSGLLLFLIAFVGVLIIEKPIFSGGSVAACFSWMVTIIIHFLLFTAMILANNLILIPYLLEKKLFDWYVGAIIALIFSYALLAGSYNRFIHVSVLHDEVIVASAGFWDNFVYALCCTAIASMLYITRKWSEQQDQMKNSQINQLQTELKYLRAQINPHFMFNGLNTVYGYIEINNHQARDMMVKFSDLLRYNLYEADVDMIALEKEIKYLENYVALQKARSNDNMQVTLETAWQSSACRVAPLIFMAFVENAFKYASRDDANANSISIVLREKDGTIDFTCINTYEETEAPGGGIGLNNAVRRLELLYKDRYVLDINKDSNIYRVHLSLTV